jgi:predicted alpha/beta hydrolase family esterase
MSINIVPTSLQPAIPLSKIDDFYFLTIPGYRNSGPGHWQTIWESLHPERFTRVVQRNWEYPEKEAWVDTIEQYIKTASRPLIVVAHSLGCIAFAQWALQYNVDAIAAALLVAPADTEKSLNPVINAFGPVPVHHLSFPSVVVASTNDPFAAIHRQANFAAYWGSKFVSVGNRGHINAASELGHWQEGLDILQTQVLDKLLPKNI